VRVSMESMMRYTASLSSSSSCAMSCTFSLTVLSSILTSFGAASSKCTSSSSVRSKNLASLSATSMEISLSPVLKAMGAFNANQNKFNWSLAGQLFQNWRAPYGEDYRSHYMQNVGFDMGKSNPPLGEYCRRTRCRLHLHLLIIGICNSGLQELLLAMGEAYQVRDQEMPYFLTFQVVGWAAVFSRKVYRDFVLENLTYCRKKYIDENPVRAGLVENPEDYLCSSARNYSGLKGLIEVDYWWFLFFFQL